MAVKKSYGGISAGPQYKTPGENIPYEMPPDNFMLFGDPEGYNALVGYSTVSPGGFGIGRGSGTDAVGFFLFNDDTLYVSNRWNPTPTGARLGMRISTAGGARAVEINARGTSMSGKEKAQIYLRGDAGNEEIALRCADLIHLDAELPGGDTCTMQLDPSSGFVGLYASDGTDHSRINLISSGSISIEGRLNCTGATLCIPRTAPASPLAGDMYVDTANSRLYVYDGTTWKYATLT